MITAQTLIKMIRKWQRLAEKGRKRISLPNTYQNVHSSTEAGKRHFVIYSIDGKRFVFHNAYLNTCIFKELLLLSQEEFGLPSDGPITFPCDASFMEYTAKLTQWGATKEVEKALMMSLASRCSHSHSIHQQEADQHVLACAC